MIMLVAMVGGPIGCASTGYSYRIGVSGGYPYPYVTPYGYTYPYWRSGPQWRYRYFLPYSPYHRPYRRFGPYPYGFHHRFGPRHW